MDTEILFRGGHDEYLESIDYLPPAQGIPRRYEVVEVTYKGAVPGTVLETQLGKWIYEGLNPKSSIEDDNVKTRSRFLLGPTRGSREYGRSKTFPHLDCYGSNSLPFSKESFELILDKFQLPAATPWMLKSSPTHFQMYTIGKTDQEKQNFGQPQLLLLNNVASILMSAGTVNAFLQGCTSDQRTEVRERLQRLYILAEHPLLLPIILVEMRMNSIKDLEERLWNLLLTVETRSGQTGAPAVNAEKYQKSNSSTEWEKLAVDALSVMQIAPFAEDHANALMLTIKEMEEMIDDLNNLPESPGRDYIKRSKRMMSEKLRFLSHGTQVIIGMVQYIVKRAEAQQSAVYNYTAQRDARLQNFMARQSSQVAQASKRDSSAMKGIAVLTMVFLPGTFLAAFFAMPILDFTADTSLPSMKHTFWLYWTITAPLTVAVLAGYAVFQRVTDQKYRREDTDLDDEWDVKSLESPRPGSLSV